MQAEEEEPREDGDQDEDELYKSSMECIQCEQDDADNSAGGSVSKDKDKKKSKEDEENSKIKEKTNAKLQQQEHKTLCAGGKCESMILHVVSIISHLHDKQKLCLSSKAAWQQVKGTKDDTPMENVCLIMDNHFTLPKVISALHDMEIGAIGTSCFRQG
eukprot:9444377-Ditylum_brightwellii.AAC.1